MTKIRNFYKQRIAQYMVTLSGGEYVYLEYVKMAIKVPGFKQAPYFDQAIEELTRENFIEIKEGSIKLVQHQK